MIKFHCDISIKGLDSLTAHILFDAGGPGTMSVIVAQTGSSHTQKTNNFWSKGGSDYSVTKKSMLACIAINGMLQISYQEADLDFCKGTN